MGVRMITETQACERVLDAVDELGWEYDCLECGTVVLTTKRQRRELRFDSFYEAWKLVERNLCQLRIYERRVAERYERETNGDNLNGIGARTGIQNRTA